MAIDLSLLVLLYGLSATPLIIIGTANLRTALFRVRLRKTSRASSASEFPLLVKLHLWILRSFLLTAVVYVFAVMFWFGTPLIVILMLWPTEASSFFVPSLVGLLLGSFCVLIEAGCQSPSSAKDLGLGVQS
ncbi:MAG: hypothetical protein EAX95_02050 [Candidatus Thorarchaeota archaeon]|nr:hypothetical protein [Candidatus Thorarchaeota archaeon]